MSQQLNGFKDQEGNKYDLPKSTYDPTTRKNTFPGDVVGVLNPFETVSLFNTKEEVDAHTAELLKTPKWVKTQQLSLPSSGGSNLYSDSALCNLDDFGLYYSGLPIRLIPVGGPTTTDVIKGRILYKHTGPDYVLTSIDNLNTLARDYNTVTFDMYILDNLDDITHMDYEPTQGSARFVSSGGVYGVIAALEARVAALERAQSEL